jgi:dynein heavy chain 2
LFSIEVSLSAPGGAVLFAGCAGASRRSLVTLAAFMHHMDVFSPKMTRLFTVKHFKNDLKTLLQRAGLEGQPTCLILEDHHLPTSAFMEMVNSVLSTGEVRWFFVFAC